MRQIREMFDYLGWPYKALILLLLVLLVVLVWVWNRD